jgi:hypothetical protein
VGRDSSHETKELFKSESPPNLKTRHLSGSAFAAIWWDGCPLGLGYGIYTCKMNLLNLPVALNLAGKQSEAANLLKHLAENAVTENRYEKLSELYVRFK